MDNQSALQPVQQEQAVPADELERRTDDELRALIARASAILEGRERERKKQALEQIRQIAKDHGLAVEVSDGPPKRRRGRPPKHSEPQTP